MTRRGRGASVRMKESQCPKLKELKCKAQAREWALSASGPTHSIRRLRSLHSAGSGVSFDAVAFPVPVSVGLGSKGREGFEGLAKIWLEYGLSLSLVPVSGAQPVERRLASNLGLALGRGRAFFWGVWYCSVGMGRRGRWDG